MLRNLPLGCFFSQLVRRQTVYTRPLQKFSSQNVATFQRTIANSATARIHHANNARRRKQLSKFTSLQQLEAETNRLISLIRQSPATSSAGNENRTAQISDKSTSHRKAGLISMDQLYQILEAWMEACLEGHGIYAAQQGLSVLQTMEENFDQSSFYTPSTSFYDIVFHAFASCQEGRVAAETVESILQRMLQRASLSRSYPQPTTKTFNIALNCWAKSNEYDAGLRAEALWRIMERRQESSTRNHDYDKKKRNAGCAPNERTMAALVEAWGNSGHEETPQRVLQLLQQASSQQKFQTAQKNSSPSQLVNAIVFTNAIRAVSRRHQGAAYAEEILRLMPQVHVQPNTRTYAAVLHAYTSASESNEMTVSKRHAAQRATAILQQMIQKYRDGAADVKPNAYCFTTCIAAWARCRDAELEPPEQAEHLWNEILQLYLESSDPAFRPSVETGNAVLMAWMRATHLDDAMNRGNNILERMRQFTQPDLRSYNILLNGMNWRGMGEEALKLLKWMEQQGPELQPDRFSFNSVLAALAKDRTLSHAQEKAEALLQRMESSNVGADHFSYATVLDAWARSEDNARKARRAEALVQIMIDRYNLGESKIRPDNFIFSNWIKACIPCKRHRYQDDAESRNSAFRALQLLKTERYGKPNCVTYTNLFRVILYTHSNDQEQQRRQLLNNTLAECADGGHVSTGIVDLLTLSKISLPSAIPASWSRSVPLRDRPIAHS